MVLSLSSISCVLVLAPAALLSQPYLAAPLTLP